MIEVKGEWYVRAGEASAAFGPDVTVAMIRRWAARGDDHPQRVRSYRLPDGSVWYRLDDLSAAELAARKQPRGRPRRVGT